MKNVYTIHSDQSSCHPKLHQYLSKNDNDGALFMRHLLKGKLDQESYAQFEQILPLIDQQKAPIILDSGCGTGMSTHYLAQRYPNHTVIGVDRSPHRLKRFQGRLTGNVLLVQMDLIQFWALAYQHQLRFDLHTLFYPNPWPKAKHLNKRFHGHPILPILIKLCDNIVIRSNWLIYLQEAHAAFAYYQLGSEIVPIKANSSLAPMTLFEKKYFENHCQCWELHTLNPDSRLLFQVGS